MCIEVSPKDGMVSYEIIQGAMTKNRFKNFLQAACGNTILKHRNSQNGYLIFDNARAHAKIEDEVPDILTIYRLPNFNPFLTMVENATSSFKEETIEAKKGRNFMVDQDPCRNTLAL